MRKVTRYQGCEWWLNHLDRTFAKIGQCIWKPKSQGLFRKRIQRRLTKTWSRRDSKQRSAFCSQANGSRWLSPHSYKSNAGRVDLILVWTLWLQTQCRKINKTHAFHSCSKLSKATGIRIRSATQNAPWDNTAKDGIYTPKWAFLVFVFL